MSKNKRKRPNNDEPMEVDEVVTNPSGAGTSNAKNGNVSGSEDEYDHISDDEEGGFRLGDIYIPPAPKPALTFDPTGPRLVISHIVNENFKSYAQTQYLGPFHKSFTAIIGPNGSGKSNVIDSMLFVFGYRATKIRSKKISVLIHSSSKYPDCQSATVAVHFCQIIDGPDESFTVVPGTEIVVSRTAFKDNSSHYTLNGRRVHFKEVATMLRAQGIDLDHNRFLILQGEVEQIAMMKPKAVTEHDFGMLEYLEDIIGTSRYKVPIQKLSLKVEELSEKRKEKLNRVRLVEHEKTKLEQPMKEAVDLMNLSNQTTVNRNLLLQKYIHEVKKMSQEKEDLKVRTEIQLQEVQERVSKVNKEIEEKDRILKEGSQKFEALQKEKDEIKARLTAAKKKTVAVQSDITVATKKTKNLRQLIDQEQSKLIEYQLIPEKNTKEIEDCEKLLKKHNENKKKADEELQAILAGVREQTRGLTEIRDRHSAKLSGLKRIVDEANSAHNLAQKQLKIYLSSGQKDMEQLEKAKTAFSNAKSQLEERKQTKAQLTSSLPQQEKKLNELQSKLQTYKNQEIEMASEVRTLRSQVEESKQAMTANRSRNRVLDSLMKEKRNGNLPGIYGRLGDLGGIDLKYDVAISTGCGALDNIVVDNVDTGTACVEYLKRHDIGRANFIALDKQTHLKEAYEKRQRYPENVPRLFDLITVTDERVLPAFYFALRDTLVATDLDQASRIAYGATRYRVVTLKGDLIEVAGTMSGGGKSVCRGRMGTSVQQDTRDHDPAVVQANERKLEGLNQSLIENRSQQKAMETEIMTLQTSVRDGRDMLDRINYDLKSLTEQVPATKNAVKELERKVAASQIDEDRKTELESTIEEAKERLDKAKFDAGEVEKERDGVDAQITALSGGRAKETQKKVNDLANKINKVATEISKLKAAINTSIRNAQKCSDQIAQMEADFAETERNLERFGVQKKQLTLENSQLQKELEEVEEKLSETPSEFAGVKKEKAKLEEKLTKIKSQMIELSGEITRIQGLIDEYASKTPTWDKELKKLKLETIEPDDSGITIPGLEAVEPLKVHSEEELEEVNIEELRARVTVLKQRLGEDVPNTNAVVEYRAKEALYLQRAADLELITNKRNEARDLYDGLKKRRQTEFLAGFNTITGKLKEMYQMITLGGDAELELVDSLDPFTEGIIFSVRPPNKSWKNISNLSGGEKTLSSLALVFALHYYKPTPLYVMDEIDAALDFKNVSIVANYIKDRTKNAQFIIISLRYMMFEASNRLVGIYKTEDCTRSVCVANKHEAIEEDSAHRTKNAQFIVISHREMMYDESDRVVGIFKITDCASSVCIANRQEAIEDENELDITSNDTQQDSNP